MTHASTPVNRDHYFQNRNFDLAEKVSRLPDAALVGAFEIAALTGIAATSIQKPTQRRSMGFPEPRVIGRLNKWPLSVVKAWLRQGGDGGDVPPESVQLHAPAIRRGRGRPTSASRHFAAAPGEK